jgi:hypothetical protein
MSQHQFLPFVTSLSSPSMKAPVNDNDVGA